MLGGFGDLGVEAAGDAVEGGGFGEALGVDEQGDQVGVEPIG